MKESAAAEGMTIGREEWDELDGTPPASAILFYCSTESSFVLSN